MPIPTSPPHLLLVDDSALVTDALRILLEASGFRVSVTNTAAAAISHAQRDPVDVLLLDLTLPDGDGLSVLARLAECGASPRTSIALTGYDDEATRARCLAAGCRTVLVKPVPALELQAQVRAAVAEGRSP